jgi:putative transposase
MKPKEIDSYSPKPGWYIYYQQQRYVIREISANGLIFHTLNLATDEPTELSAATLLLDSKSAAPPFFAATLANLNQQIDQLYPEPSATFAKLPAGFVERAEAIVSIIEKVDKILQSAERRAKTRQEKFYRTKAIELALHQLGDPIQLSTYYKQRKLYDQWHGDVNAIAADMRRNTFRQAHLSSGSRHLAETLIMRWRNRKHPVPVGELYRLMASLLKNREGWWIDPQQCKGEYPHDLIAELLDPALPIQSILDNPEKRSLLTPTNLPGRSWFYQYVQWYERFGDHGKEVFIAQHGRAAYEEEFMVFDTYVTRALYPLQYVFFDHWLVDVFVVDDETRSQPYRLWFTAAIDAYSRCVLGFALLEEYPCIESVTTALKHMLWPKQSHEALGMTDPWICWGIPTAIFMDNAWAHQSETIRQLARAIGQNGRFNTIELKFRPPYKARYGALIERFFGNLSQRMKHHLVGSITSSQAQAVRNAAKEASLIYQDIHKFLHEEVVNYQHTVHSELDGMTPHEKWLEGIKHMQPIAPPLTPELERRFMRLLQDSGSDRVIERDGMSVFGLTYWADEMSGLPRKKGQSSVKYLVYYDVNDLHRIAIFAKEENIWLCDAYAKQLRRPDGSYRETTLWERKVAQRLAVTAGKNPRDWFLYLDQQEQLNTIRRAEKARLERRAKKSAATPAKRISKKQLHTADEQLDQLAPDAGYASYGDLLAGFMQTNQQDDV